ncbi:MAG TPA: 4'-phosphopantetheinyl transferase superfamily protein [Desulfotignum sp.]|nr:4'-phosphopantetheinyl transferase superfamily protein [Desulfotignum sp.]
MIYNSDILHRRAISLPGYTEKPVIVQTARIPDILNAVFHPGMQPNGQSIKNRVFDQPMFGKRFLSDDEMVQVNRFKALKKQMEWICGRFAVKALVKDTLELDMSLTDIQIAYKEKGAPYLPHFPQIPISLSHSGDYTAVALSRHPEILLGIDIEKITALPGDSFMKTAFTGEEITHMPKTAPAVFANWTLKEAFLKYLGLGFNESLHHVAIIDAQIFHQGKKQPVSTWQTVLDNRYALGLVYGKSVQQKDSAQAYLL